MPTKTYSPKEIASLFVKANTRNEAESALKEKGFKEDQIKKLSSIASYIFIEHEGTTDDEVYFRKLTYELEIDETDKIGRWRSQYLLTVECG